MMHRPAYAPEYFADRRIKFTIPYTMPGELLITAGQSGVQFPEAQFLHNVDKPFEIWRMLVRLTAFDTADPAVILSEQPTDLLRKLIRLSILDTSKNERITKNPALVDALLKENERTWEWDPRPYTIVRQEGFQVAVDAAQVFPTVCQPSVQDCTATPVEIGSIRVEVAFEGWLLVLEPPSNTR